MTAATEPTTGPTTMTASTQPASQPLVIVPASAPAAYGKPLSMNFRDAPIRTVLEYLSETAGLTIIEDARPDSRVTVMSRQSISVDEAVALLDTVLRQKGYAAVYSGKTLKIVTADQAKKELIPVRTITDVRQLQAIDRVGTFIVPVRSVDAAKLKTDLANLIPSGTDVATNASSNTLIFTGPEANVRKIMEVIQAIDVQTSQISVKVFLLKNANAAGAAKLIMDIFKEDPATGTQAGGFGGGGRRAFLTGGMGPGGPFGGGAAAASTADDQSRKNAKVTASSDDRTNTLVVSAAPEIMKAIEGVVKELDADPTENQAVFIYHLKNATAVNLEPVLNNIFGASSSGYSTAAGRTNASALSGGTSGAFGRGTGGGGGSSGGRGLNSSAFGQTSGTGAGTGRATGTAGRTTGAAGRSTGGGGRGLSAGTAALAGDLAGQVYVVADPDTNSLVVTTGSKNFERVRAIIMDLDRAVPQVLIKVLIAEVTHDNSLDLGVEFSGMNLDSTGQGWKTGTNFNVAAQAAGFTFKLNEENVTAAIRAIAGVSKLDVLSRPYILTSDNQQASILVGQEVPFVTNTRTTDTGQTINTIEYDSIGIILNVTPHINPQGLVTMDVYPEISTLTGETVPISETLSAPVYARRAAQSRVAIRDGQTIVIGGLMEDRNTASIDKVPVLGDLPGLGPLFQRRIEKKTKTELLIFMTPHVALQPEELPGMSKDETSGAKIIDKAVEPGAFEEHMRGMDRGASTRPAGDQGDYRTFEPVTPAPQTSDPGEPNVRMDLGE